MGGGIIQLATYGTQDIYLTGSPEITFFKVVYRRHTNFAIESLKLDFDDEFGFDTTSSITIPKNGDLLYRMYLEFDIPQVRLKRYTLPDSTDALTAYNTAKTKYNQIIDFHLYNMKMYRDAFIIYKASNSTVSDMQSIITNVFNSNTSRFNEESSTSEIAKYIAILNNDELKYKITNIYMKDLSDSYSGNSKDELFGKLENAKLLMNEIQTIYQKEMQDVKLVYDDTISPYAKFAWVDRLGHALIDYVEVDIGGTTIDRHYSDWINIWNQLTLKDTQEINYNKMIGNVTKLTTFDRNTRPSYTIKVPLNFWFNRFNGLALPIISLENNDVIFRLKTRTLNEVAYIEQDVDIKLDNYTNAMSLLDLEEDEHIQLQARLYMDYVFLGRDERKRFAQVSNEYLIENVQVHEINGLSTQKYEVDLDFIHPTKALFWVVSKDSYRENLTGYNKCRWDNYTTDADKTKNPIMNTNIFFHGENRVDILSNTEAEFYNGKYYQLVQPHRYFKRSPDKGINCYSFALYPTEYQPSGQCNMSRLTSVKMVFDFDPDMFNNDDTLSLKIFAVNYNILRFSGGYGALAFSNRE